MQKNTPPDDIPIGIINPIKTALANALHQQHDIVQAPKNNPKNQTAQLERADQILALLPQTQCTKCGYSGCAEYAKAIANQTTNYNQCPPGGAEGIERLADFLNKPIIPLNTAHGTERVRRVAVINPNQCIGCTLCIQACPTDAIIGSSKYLHTVLNDACTGCDLCVSPCPVDCIEMLELPELVATQKTGWQGWSQAQANLARNRFEQKIARKKAEHLKSADRISQKQAEKQALIAENTDEQRKAQQKKEMIARAMARAKERLADH